MNYQRKISLLAFIALVVGFLASFNSNAQTLKTPKFGKGIKYEAADTSMSMVMHVRMQNLLETGYNNETHKENTNISVRRYRLKFDGHAFHPNFRYKMELGISNRDQGNKENKDYVSEASNIVLDAVVKYKFANDHLDLWFGQTKLPSNRERVISSANLQFVDRSNVNSQYNIDRDQGIQLHGDFNIGKMVINPRLAWSMGEGRNITHSNLGGYDYTARLDFLPLGKFEGKSADYVSSDLDRQSKPKIAIGVTYDNNVRSVRQGGQLGAFITDSTGKKLIENTLTTVFIDAVFKYKGISVLAEYANKKGEKLIDNTSSKYKTGSGLTTQAGYLFKNNYEIALRYSTVTPDNKKYSAVTQQEEFTLGLSKYIVGHSLKVQSDFSYFKTPGDISNKKDDFRFRLQVELQL